MQSLSYHNSLFAFLFMNTLFLTIRKSWLVIALILNILFIFHRRILILHSLPSIIIYIDVIIWVACVLIEVINLFKVYCFVLYMLYVFKVFVTFILNKIIILFFKTIKIRILKQLILQYKLFFRAWLLLQISGIIRLRFGFLRVC